MVNIVRRIRDQRGTILARDRVRPDAIYGTVSAGYRTLRGRLFHDDKPDFGAVGADERYDPSCGYQQSPPPRSGGEPYVALYWIYEYCIEYPMMMDALQSGLVTSGALEATGDIVGQIGASHVTMHYCWYDAAPFVARWVMDLERDLFFDDRSGDLMREEFRVLGDPLRGGIDPERSERRLEAWRGVLRLAGVRSARAARLLTEASLSLECAAKLYVQCLRRLCAARHPRDRRSVLRDVRSVEWAGNLLCASSSRLITPAYNALYYRFLHLHTLEILEKEKRARAMQREAKLRARRGRKRS